MFFFQSSHILFSNNIDTFVEMWYSMQDDFSTKKEVVFA